MAETPVHRDNLIRAIQILQRHFAADPFVYVSGNMFVYYVEGDKRKHVAPDVFFVRGVPKVPERDYYLTWIEGKNPDLVIEMTSASTREEDTDEKFQLYQNTLRVQEYFMFDPREEHLDPPLQGYALRRGKYAPLRPVHGRLPSKALSLHLEAADDKLRFYDPAESRWLPTPQEEIEQLREELAELRRRSPK